MFCLHISFQVPVVRSSATMASQALVPDWKHLQLVAGLTDFALLPLQSGSELVGGVLIAYARTKGKDSAQSFGSRQLLSKKWTSDLLLPPPALAPAVLPLLGASAQHLDMLSLVLTQCCVGADRELMRMVSGSIQRLVDARRVQRPPQPNEKALHWSRLQTVDEPGPLVIVNVVGQLIYSFDFLLCRYARCCKMWLRGPTCSRWLQP